MAAEAISDFSSDFFEFNLNRKRPANRAFRMFLTREKVCPLTGKLRASHDEGYDFLWS